MHHENIKKDIEIDLNILDEPRINMFTCKIRAFPVCRYTTASHFAKLDWSNRLFCVVIGITTFVPLGTLASLPVKW